MHRIPLPLPNDGLRAVNVYAIESGDDLVLVDAGWALAETGGLLDSGSASSAAARPRSPAAWSPTCTGTTTRWRLSCASRFGTQVALGIGDRPSLTARCNGTGRP